MLLVGGGVFSFSLELSSLYVCSGCSCYFLLTPHLMTEVTIFKAVNTVCYMLSDR